jgi:hypothetical protein
LNYGFRTGSFGLFIACGDHRTNMICPACDHALTEMKLGKLTVDACHRGCGGIWFDNFELRKADGEFAAEAILRIERDDLRLVDYERRRQCPRCDGVVMMRHFFSGQRETEVDTCPNCGGAWLDAGELTAIRREAHGEKQAEEAAQSYFRRLFEQDYMQTRGRK